jgi:hypothetical protein
MKRISNDIDRSLNRLRGGVINGLDTGTNNFVFSQVAHVGIDIYVQVAFPINHGHELPSLPA